jgi:predicted house-cleaning NTP pyrophosphatase (Maf/HAM1 superfamily)
LRGALNSQDVVTASGRQRTHYVLGSDQPVCVHEEWQDKPAADEQISQIQIVGSPPFPQVGDQLITNI